MAMTEPMLEQFAARIGLPRASLATATGSSSEAGLLAALSAMCVAFTSTIPFEQLDPALGRGVDTSLTTVFLKLVVHRRGGYCFEVSPRVFETLNCPLLMFAFPLTRRAHCWQR